MSKLNQYTLDPEKIDDLEDVIEILKAMDFQMTERHSSFDELEPYLKKVNDQRNNR